MPYVKPIGERFWPRVRKTETCWLWEGARDNRGYGEISSGPRPARILAAHRVAWELTYGPIPPGRYLLHSCDNPPCVRPDHLRLGTHAENAEDLKRRGAGRATPRQMIRTGPHMVPIADRFWPRVEKTDSCWLWQGHQLKSGHGTIGRGGRKAGHMLAHRLSWELANGPIPEGACVLHRCDVPNCVNPEHLFLGTRPDNSADMVAKGRAANGLTKKDAKLTPDQVREIRRRYAQRDPRPSTRVWRNPDSFAALAEDFGVNEATIRDAVKRKTWTHID